MFTTFKFRGHAGIVGALVAPGAAAILLAIAACQDELPSAPRQPAAASAEKGGNAIGRIGNGVAVWTLRDGNLSHLIGGAQFVLTGPNNVSLLVTDNLTPADQDAAAGSFKTMGLTPGQYQLCEIVPPASYVLPQSACESATIKSNSTTTVGPFYNYHVPRESWSVVDPVGNLLGNAYFTLYNSSLQVVASGWDNAAAFDQDNTLGKFLKENASGSYTLCETLAPSGFVVQAPTCKIFTATPGFAPQSLGKFLNTPSYSIYFNVQDPQGKPLGGSTFVVKREFYSPAGDVNVADNVAPDRDPTTGKYFVIVPAAGNYWVCQHDAPFGYDPPPANASCSLYAANVKLGVPGNAGTFVDTPWPVAR